MTAPTIERIDPADQGAGGDRAAPLARGHDRLRARRLRRRRAARRPDGHPDHPSGIDTLLLAGLSTSGVVLSAVRDGHDRDYRLIVVSDLTADPEPDLQQFLISRVILRQADVIAAADLPSLLS
jgi:hypothetical protein